VHPNRERGVRTVATYRVHEGSLNERFLKSRAKVQLFAGGFANGKTASACIRGIELAKDYPGSNGLIARSTYPKLNDTIRKEFLKWCPEDWIKSFPRSQNASNTCTLTNGTTVNFRYIQQQGKNNQESTTSNLLSATYDWIIVDQIEDPEIVYKDFLDLLGRLRGTAKYIGSDPSMPLTGPRWFIITSNPTRNWVYKYIVKPLQSLLESGRVTEELMCEVDENGSVILNEDGLPTPIIEIYEGSTYENEQNLEADYIRTLEATYKGQMRDRFLLGKWAAYEGLVYPAFEDSVHVMSHESVVSYYRRLQMTTSSLTILEGYDYGMAVPFCYLAGFVDDRGNVFLMAGEYEREVPLQDEFFPNGGGQVERIKTIREEYGISSDNHILSDPDIFRRKTQTGKLVGKSIASMFSDEGIYCSRGNNDISNGIVKVTQYLAPIKNHCNPITGVYGMPHLYISDQLQWLIDEFNGYYWQTDSVGDRIEKPKDKDDHGMDTIKYILSHQPDISVLLRSGKPKQVGWLQWGERELQQNVTDPRHSSTVKFNG